MYGAVSVEIETVGVVLVRAELVVRGASVVDSMGIVVLAGAVLVATGSSVADAVVDGTREHPPACPAWSW